MAETEKPGPRPHPHPGFFLVLDGPDGGGKTTQAARLADWLRDRGLDVVSCRDPGGTALGDRLRSILLDRDSVSISLRSEMLLYMASRAQMVEEIIRPALEMGRVVICDRFLLANLIYQGYAGGLPVEQITVVGDVATGRLRPDLTLILDVDVDVARRGSEGRGTGSRIGPRTTERACNRAIARRRRAPVGDQPCRCVIAPRSS